MPVEAIRTMVAHTPALLSINISRMEDSFRFVQRNLECSAEETMSIFARVPTTPTLNVTTNLGPKVAFLTGEGGIPLEKLRQQPFWITHSLDTRIRPRLDFARTKNIPFRLSLLSYVN